MPVSGGRIDGIGMDRLWNDMLDYAGDMTGGVADTMLPIPRYSVEYSDTSATIKVMNTFTGYGDVTVRYKKDSEPTAADTEVGSGGVIVTESGTYYLRAFPDTGNDSTASGSAIVRIAIGG